MRFKVDESLHVEIADLLRERGQDALTVFDQKARGRSDRAVKGDVRAERAQKACRHFEKEPGRRDSGSDQ